MARELQRRRREAGQRIEREAHHLLQRIFGLTGEALLPVVGEWRPAEADPCNHAANEPRLLGHRQKRIERAAAHQPEVAGVDRNVDLGRARQQPVEAMRCRPLERRLARAARADAVDDVRAFVSHHFHHLGQKLRRVLEVGVDDQDRIAAAEVETRRERELMAMIARQVDRDDVDVLRRHLAHHRPAIVARAVIDEHDLIILAHCRDAQPRSAAREAREGTPAR